MVVSSIDSATTWDALPISLRPPVYTTAEKANHVTWNIFSILVPVIGAARLASFGMGYLTRNLILLAKTYSNTTKAYWHQQFDRLCDEYKAHWEITPHTITTPDQARLSIHFFRHRDGNVSTPTTLYFQGSGALKGMGNWRWLLDESKDRSKPMNFVLFDYRSVDQSTGTFTGPQDLLIDATSIIHWLRTEMQIPNDQIHLYGLSLGGAIATKTAAADEQLAGWIVSERSFSSLEQWIHAQVSKARETLHSQQPKNFIGHCVKWFLTKGLLLEALAVKILKTQSLECDTVADFSKLHGKKLIVCHPQDAVIPYDASLAKRFPEGAYLLEGHYGDNHNTLLERYPGARTHIGDFVFT